jgi:hypothetical protein
MVEFAYKPSYEIARRLEMRGEGSYSWSILIKPPSSDVAALQEFAEELEAFVRQKPRIVDITGLLVGDLREQLQEPPGDPVLLVGFDERSPEFWSAVDLNRSSLERSGAVVFWLSAAGVSDLCTHAPNLRSFIGGSIFVVGSTGGEMAANERAERLRDLSAFYGLTNDQIIEKAMKRELPREPEFVEWLVLLGRGDLV